MSYRRRPSPLHAARAGAGSAFCLALGVAGLVVSNPILLGGLIAGVVLAGLGAGVGREMRRIGLWALPVAVSIVLINALVTRSGLTVIARLGTLPVLGRTDVTLEATVFGGVLALRAALLILSAGLFSLCVDPDEMLRAFRRVSFSSALSATLATRLIPVLARDSRRVAEAQRCRPGAPPSRLALARAVTAGMLDRALDVAATLELRGYGSRRRPVRLARPWSRHDLAFLTAAGAILLVAILARFGDRAVFTAYPLLHLAAGWWPWLLGAGLVGLAGLPFLDRRGIEP